MRLAGRDYKDYSGKGSYYFVRESGCLRLPNKWRSAGCVLLFRRSDSCATIHGLFWLQSPKQAIIAAY